MYLIRSKYLNYWCMNFIPMSSEKGFGIRRFVFPLIDSIAVSVAEADEILRGAPFETKLSFVPNEKLRHLGIV
jgi:hypothetical protein